MTINTTSISSFGQFPTTILFSRNGNLTFRNNPADKATIQDVARIYQTLGSENYTSFQDLFKLSTPSTGSHESMTLFEGLVSEGKRDALKGATHLVTRLKVKKNNLKATGLISLITNIFIRKAYNALIQTLEQAIANIEKQKLPTIPKKVYSNIDDCITLLNQNGFKELPEDEIRALATSMASSRHPLQLTTAGQLSNPEEIREFNKMVLAHLDKNPAYNLASLKHNLITLSFTNSPIITLDRYNEVLKTLEKSNKIEGDSVSRKFGFHNYLSQDDFSSFAEFIDRENIYFENSQMVEPTELNKIIFATALNKFLSLRDHISPALISRERGNLDTFFTHPGRIFSQLLQETMKIEHSGTKLTEIRALQLLRTLGYGNTPLSKSLAKYLVAQNFRFHHYSHLLDIETQKFNPLIISFLRSISTESGDRTGLLGGLEARHSSSPSQITRSEFEDAYLFFTSKCVDDFTVQPKSKMRTRINLLLENIGMSRSMNPDELKAFQDLIIESKLKFGENGMLGHTNQGFFNQLFFGFLSKTFLDNFTTLNTNYKDSMIAEITADEICDASLLWDKCKNPTAHNEANLNFIVNEMKLNKTLTDDLVSYLKDAQFTVFKPKDLSESERAALSNYLLGYINSKHPEANLPLDGRQLTGASFNSLLIKATVDAVYPEVDPLAELDAITAEALAET